MGSKKGIKMKTIGIITFHQALNYGAALQAYALKAVCDEIGYEVHIIDYDYCGIEEKVAPFAKYLTSKDKKLAFPALVRGLLGYRGDKKREKAFWDFRTHYFSESPKCISPNDINKLGYDILIGGSDQIWNRGITKHRYDPVFFMNFDTTAHKIIYAASSEDVPFHGEKEEKFIDELKNIQGIISIREKKLADYVETLTGEHYPVVLDPTLLAGRDIMDSIEMPEPPSKPYILLYQIDSNPESNISIKTLEERFGCNVYNMSVPRIGDHYGRKGDVGPEEFLSILKGAEFLVTNSFHGVAISLLYEKQFYVYENKGVMSRIDGLLDQLDLKNRKVRMVTDILQEKQIDYGKVNLILDKLRKESKEFLIQALKY